MVGTMRRQNGSLGGEDFCILNAQIIINLFGCLAELNYVYLIYIMNRDAGNWQNAYEIQVGFFIPSGYQRI